MDGIVKLNPGQTLSDVLNKSDHEPIIENQVKNPESDRDSLKFPLEVLPEVVRDYIDSNAECLNLVPDFMGTAFISAAASILGNSYVLKIKEGWYERPLFWNVIVGSSGMRKTPSIDKIIFPLHKIDMHFYDKYQSDLRANEERQTNFNSRQLIVTDTTIEALINTLESNSNGILLYKDELISWINDLTRYSKGSAEPQWLSIYSNQPIKLNRKTNKEIVRIENPFVNVLGGIQPGILKTLFSDDREANGFTSRLLFTFPSKIDRTISTKEVPQQLNESYRNYVNRFAGLNGLIKIENPEQHVVDFDQYARDEFFAWSNSYINKQLNNNNINEREEAVLSKLEAVCARLALVLHISTALANSVEIPVTIGIKTLKDAQILVNYYFANFQKVYDLLNNDESNKDPIELKISRIVIMRMMEGIPLSNIAKELNSLGFKNVQIKNVLNVHRNTISNWIN